MTNQDPNLSVQALLEIMQKLRDPVTGCDWDKQQTFESIAPYTLEEAYEVVHAIDLQDYEELRDELGDLLLQVVFHSQLAEESGLFSFADVVSAIADKMTRRHPHVFGNVQYANDAEQKAAWESIKAEERAKKCKPSAPESALDAISLNLPALVYANKIQQRAARVGFDWPSISPVWEKLDEEVDELKQALHNTSQEEVEDELGDVLFTVVNLARHMSVDSESALRRATQKFTHRFKHVEELAKQTDLQLDDLSLEELDELWNQAKGQSASR